MLFCQNCLAFIIPFRTLCSNCRNLLQKQLKTESQFPFRCKKCGKVSVYPMDHCPFCSELGTDYPLECVFSHHGSFFESYKRQKKLRKKGLLKVLSSFLKLPRTERILLVPIPSTKSKNKTYIPWGWEIAKELRRNIGNKIEVLDILGRKPGPSQKSVTKNKRMENIEKQLYLKNSKNLPKEIYLVDDILTTGSSFLASQKVLTQAGVKVLGGFCLFSRVY